MFYVDLLRSKWEPDQTYIGLTSDLKTRLAKHDEGGSPHTAKHRPWSLVTYIAFRDRSPSAESKLLATSLTP